MQMIEKIDHLFEISSWLLGVVQIFDREVKRYFFIHALLDSGPEATGSRTCICKNGRYN